MSNAPATQPQTPAARPANLPAIAGPRLPYHPAVKDRFGVDASGWKALVEAVFPNATSPDSVILALSYCKARNLDIFKRNVHIVGIWNKEKGCMVDSIWPGIGELRTTAFRTGEYCGRGQTEFGPDIEKKIGTADMVFPEWARVTVYRMVRNQKCEFVGPKVYWEETYAESKRTDPTPNEMWRGRPRGQIDKCAEAAALRAAFPEEVGCEYTNDEVSHIGVTAEVRSKKNIEASGTERMAALLGESSPVLETIPQAVQQTVQEPVEHDDGGPTPEDLAGTVDHDETQKPRIDPIPMIISAINKAKSVEAIEAMVADEQNADVHSPEDFAKIVAAMNARKAVLASKGGAK